MEERERALTTLGYTDGRGLTRPARWDNFSPQMKATLLLRLAPLLALAIGFLRVSPSSAQTPPAPSPLLPQPGRMDPIVRHFGTDWNGVSDFYDLPWSTTRFDRLEHLAAEWQERLGLLDFASLDQPEKIDYLLLRQKLAAERNDLGLRRRRLAEMEPLLTFRSAIQELERIRWQMKPLDASTSAAAVAALPEQIRVLRERIEQWKKQTSDLAAQETKSSGAPAETRGQAATSTPANAKAEVAPLKVSPALAKRAAAAVDDLRGTLRNWFAAYDGYQPEFSWWLKKPQEEASKALEEYAKFLREEIAGIKGKDEDPLLGDPIGSEQLAEAIGAEMLPYSAEELIALGEREFAWCEARMKEAAQEMGLGEDWKAALAKVKGAFVPPGKQDELIPEMARQSIEFLQQRDLVTLPPLCLETWRLTMISPEGQKTIPYAAYGGQNMMVAYANEEMKHADKLMSMRGNNRSFTRIVTAHELIPGHHLQAFQAARQRPYRALFSTPFLVEGWAVYWEMLLWDLGYGRSSEERMGMLFWRLNRSARILLSLKFHLGRMTPVEMVDFLVERVGHERLGARSEVRRFIGGSYSPLYQSGYTVGALQLRALHREVVGKGQMTAKQFHDALLTYGPIPIELIRAGMLNLPLTRSTRSGWRFAD